MRLVYSWLDWLYESNLCLLHLGDQINKTENCSIFIYMPSLATLGAFGVSLALVMFVQASLLLMAGQGV